MGRNEPEGSSGLEVCLVLHSAWFDGAELDIGQVAGVSRHSQERRHPWRRRLGLYLSGRMRRRVA
jgi:hypothetical protein